MFNMPEKKVKRSLGRQFFYIVSGSVIIGFATIIFLTASTQRSNLRQLAVHNSQDMAFILASNLSGAVKWEKEEVIEKIYSDFTTNTDSSIASLVVFNRDKQILAQFSSEELQPYNLSKIFDSNLETEDLYFGKQVRYEGHDYFTTIVPIKAGAYNATVGYLAIAASLEGVNTIIYTTTLQQATILLCMMVIILALLHIALKNTIITPLNAITKKLHQISEGDRTVTIPTRDKDDELGVMVETFNQMLDQIDARDAILIHANEQLRSESARIALLQETTVAANQAQSIEEAFQSTINNICHYTNWPVGHVYLYQPESKMLLSSGIWHLEDMEKFETFKRESENTQLALNVGMPGKVLASKEPIWIENILQSDSFVRSQGARIVGLHTGVGFPVLNNLGEVWAIVEFFTPQIRQKDESLIDLFENIAVQLSRVIERKEAEEALRVAKEEADYAREFAEQANIAKSEFLSNMSHELRTPLHGILSYTSLGISKNKEASPEKILGYFTTIKSSGERLLSLLDNLLDLSKLESGKMEFRFHKADLKETTAKALVELHGVIEEKKITVNIDQAKIISRAYFDENKILQVIINLLSNAIKFTPSGKSIFITFEKTTLPKEHAEGTKEQSAVSLSIIDQGIGIPEDELGAVFDKFIQSSKTKTGAGGTGLGLAICQEIIDGHKGRIWAENMPDGGAKFTFILPERH